MEKIKKWNLQATYLANTKCLLGLFVPGPVGLHLIVYISYKIIIQFFQIPTICITHDKIKRKYKLHQTLRNIHNWYLGMLPKLMKIFILFHTPYLQNKKQHTEYKHNNFTNSSAKYIFYLIKIFHKMFDCKIQHQQKTSYFME